VFGSVIFEPVVCVRYDDLRTTFGVIFNFVSFKLLYNVDFNF